MKKFLLILPALLFSFISLSGSVTYSIHFDKSKIRTEEIAYDGADYTLVKYDGLAQYGGINQASLPGMEYYVSVPFNADDFTIDVKTENLSEITLPSPLFIEPPYCCSEDQYEMDESTDGPSLTFTAHAINSPGGFWKGIYKVVCITVAPLIQQPDSDNLIFCEDITVTLNWTPKFMSDIKNCVPFNNSDPTALSYVQSKVINPEDTEKYRYDWRRPEPGSRMVVEGRTWWYETFARASAFAKRYLEIGIGIREEVEIDGVRWHKIKVVADRILDANAELLEMGEKDLCIGYIRETPEDVYVMLDKEGIEQHDVLKELIWNTGWHFENGRPYLLYHFGFTGDRFVMGDTGGGNEFFSVNYTVDSRETISYGNYRYVQDLIKSDSELLHQHETEYLQIEGIGQFSSEDYPCGELFFVPMYPPLAGYGYDVMKLRYVTNARNNRVIYEREGGLKLWQELGVANVEADATEAPARWYNLQGVEVAEPDGAGVYLKVSGSRAEKIIVR